MAPPLLPVSAAARERARALLDFIDESPSPWHAVASAVAMLERAGYRPLDQTASWKLAPGDRCYVIRDGSTLAAFRIGESSPVETGLRLIGAHTDSPGLRVKPCAGEIKSDWLRLGVEIYGGPILATFTDRDLSLAGRVAVRAPAAALGVDSRLVRFATPLLRIPNLAIHLNRKVNDDGLRLDRQLALPPILGAVEDGLPASGQLNRLLADALAVEPTDILGFDLNVYDTQPGTFFGAQQEFIADSQIDNLGSCHAALLALLATDTDPPAATSLCLLFDHEEVGSTSAKGADSSFLEDVLERIALCLGLDRADYRRVLAASMLVSADMAHAYHPGHPGAYDDQHRVHVNHGPVIKTNASQRYTSDSLSAGAFQLACERAGVPSQQYVQRTDMACGSTIGPLVASRLGVRSVDVGSPMWAMHSARESAGTADHGAMCRALTEFLRG